MIIVLGSQSEIKKCAVVAALEEMNLPVEIICVKAASAVSKQPLEEETLRGARQRIESAMSIRPGADCYIAIENGLFKTDEGYLDKAVILLKLPSEPKEFIKYSEEVVFPQAYVEEARGIGFDKETVGQVMARHGVVARHDDPHLDLAGKSRQIILTETLVRLFKEDLEWHEARPPILRNLLPSKDRQP